GVKGTLKAMSGAREAQGRQAAAVINASPTRSASAVARSPKRGRSHQEIVRVLIVGAGPVGLVMAHELARYGVECRVIDKQRDRPMTSRARWETLSGNGATCSPARGESS